MSEKSRKIGTLAGILLLLTVTGCGVKGGLQAPPTAEEQAVEEQKRAERDEGWWERLLP